MFKFKKDFPCHLLIGNTLTSLNFTYVTINLHFTNYQHGSNNPNGVEIFISSDYLLKSIGEILENNVEAATPLCRLLGKEVISAKINSPTELQIDFVDDTLFIYDDSEHYESMTFKYDGKLIVV